MTVDLVAGDLLAVRAGDDGDRLVVLVEDAQGGVGDLDGDGLAGVAVPDLEALAGDLDLALDRDSALDPDRL